MGASTHEQDDGTDMGDSSEGTGGRLEDSRDRNSEGAAGFCSFHVQILQIFANTTDGKACPQLTFPILP